MKVILMEDKKLTMSENIRGLEIILERESAPFISVDYMIEKLIRIRNGNMILHENIVNDVKDERE